MSNYISIDQELKEFLDNNAKRFENGSREESYNQEIKRILRSKGVKI